MSNEAAEAVAVCTWRVVCLLWPRLPSPIWTPNRKWWEEYLHVFSLQLCTLCKMSQRSLWRTSHIEWNKWHKWFYNRERNSDYRNRRWSVEVASQLWWKQTFMFRTTSRLWFMYFGIDFEVFDILWSFDHIFTLINKQWPVNIKKIKLWCYSLKMHTLPFNFINQILVEINKFVCKIYLQYPCLALSKNPDPQKEVSEWSGLIEAVSWILAMTWAWIVVLLFLLAAWPKIAPARPVN